MENEFDCEKVINLLGNKDAKIIIRIKGRMWLKVRDKQKEQIRVRTNKHVEDEELYVK